MKNQMNFEELDSLEKLTIVDQQVNRVKLLLNFFCEAFDRLKFTGVALFVENFPLQ